MKECFERQIKSNRKIMTGHGDSYRKTKIPVKLAWFSWLELQQAGPA